VRIILFIVYLSNRFFWVMR